jgi:hypothetical protein
VKEQVERPPGAAALLCDSEPFVMLFLTGDNNNAACFPDAQYALRKPVPLDAGNNRNVSQPLYPTSRTQ